MSERALCTVCHGNGVLKIPGGLSVCGGCRGDGWASACTEPSADPAFRRHMFVCPECGPRVGVDDDGTCRSCGADCTVAPYAAPSADPALPPPANAGDDSLPGTPGREEPTAMRLQAQPDNATVTKDLAEWLRDSLRSGLLFGCFDEPLDDAGKRVVRAILARLQ